MPRLIISIMSLGCILLIWGLVSLYQIINLERIEATSSLASQKQSLSHFALRQLQHELKLRIREARKKIRESLRDPLLSGQDLLYFDQGKQIIPREQPFASQQSFQSRKAYFWLYNRKFDVIPSEDDLPWLQRITRFRLFTEAINNNDDSQINAAFWDIQEHRSRYIISAEKDIPYMLALLSYFSDKSSPRTDMMRQFLRDGVKDAQGKVAMKGLQRILLEKRSKFSRPNFAFLSEQVIRLSRKYNVPYADFQKSALAPSPALPDVKHIREAAFIDYARWYIEPETAGRLIGIKVNLNKLVEKVETKMKNTGLIRPDDYLLRNNFARGLTPLSSISLSVQSRGWRTSLLKIDQRYYLKTGWIIACGIFALAMVTLASLHQYRKHKYLSLKSDFLSAVSHELRTPLTSIRLIAETLENRLRDNPAAKDYPSRIVRDIDGLSLLVENILSYNRLQKGQWAIHKGRIDLDSILDSIRSEIHLHTSKQVTITQENTDGLKIDADAELFKMLLFNLVRNSCHYNDNSEVSIKIWGDDKHHNHLWISDNGIGIDRQHWNKVFQDFYRIQEKSAQNIRGSGLGLSMCKRIMGLHHGKIRIARSDHNGTTFELIF